MEKEVKIKCAYCGEETNFVKSDFDDGKDLSDFYCSNECRYESETGKSGEEY